MSTLPPPTPNRRENDNFELDRFKHDIDLVRYATERHQYTITAEGKNGQWHHLEKGGEKLLVSSGKGQEYPLYKNLHDERDAGSIIEFAQARGEGRNGPGLNLGEVRKELRSYLGEQGPELAARPVPLQFPERQATARELPAGASDEERREALVRQVLGAERGLTDRSYLHSRHITNETIDSPAFQNRIFTSQENRHQNTAFPYYNESGIAQVSSKNQEPGAPKWDRFIEGLPKEGIWVSNPTEGRGTKVERIVISESPIDSLSYHQLHQRAGSPNTMYVATGGTPTEKQAELIQKVIDRQQPREVSLATDRDPSGMRYNINYLNDLGPSRRTTQVADQQVPEGSARPIEWHATSEGKYHNKIKVEFHTDKAFEGRAAIAQLGEQIAAINSGQNRSGEVASLQLEVVRTSSKESVARVIAPLADSAQLLEVGRYLHQQREALLPERERQPSSFIKLEPPITKDYNQDLGLTVAGKSQAEIQAFSEQQQRQYLEEKLLKQQQEQQARQLQEQQQAEQRQREQQEREEAQRQAREKAASSPEAQREREREDRALGQFVGAVAAAEIRTMTQEVPHGPAEKGEPLREQFSLMAQLRVQEPAPLPGTLPENEGPYARSLRETLEKGGATVSVTDKHGVGLVTYQGVSETELQVGFNRDQAGAAALSRTLDQLSVTPGVAVREYQAPAERAQYYANQPEAQPLSLPERAEPLSLQRVLVESASLTTAQQGQQALRATGAEVGEVRLQEGVAGVVPDTHRFPVSYRLDQPELPVIHAALTHLASREQTEVIQFREVATVREQAAVNISTQWHEAEQAGRTVQLSKPGTSVEAQAELRQVGNELKELGMRVGPVETERGMASVEAGYRLTQPELPRINEALQEVGPRHQVLLYQESGLVREREQVLATLPQEPPQRWSGPQVEQVQLQLEQNLRTQPYGPEREAGATLAPAEWNRLTVVVEQGSAARDLQQQLEQAGARVREGVNGQTPPVYFVDGTSSPATSYQLLHVAYPPATEGGRPAEVQRALEETQQRGQTVLLDRHGDQRPQALNSEAYQERWKLDLAVQPSTQVEMRPHANGGGMVQTTAHVEPSVYVGPQARVLGNAVVEGNVRLEDNALVGGAARLGGSAVVRENAVVLDGAIVQGQAVVSGNARLSGHVQVQDEAQISGRAQVSGQAQVMGQAQVGEQASVTDRAIVSEQARVVGNGEMGGATRLFGTQQVGEPNPPVPDFARVVVGLGQPGEGAAARDAERLSADQRLALQPSTLVEPEVRRAMQQQATEPGISADARVWATGFYAGSVLPPDHAGNAEKYAVLRLATTEAAQQVRQDLLASGGHLDVHVSESRPVPREGFGLRPDARDNDHELRVAYHLAGPSLPAVHAALKEATEHPQVVRTFERPLDVLDRTAEVERRPQLVEVARGVEAGRESTVPGAYQVPAPQTMSWLETAAAPRPAEGPAAGDKTIVVQVAEPTREGELPAAERVRQQLATTSLATVGPILPQEVPAGAPAGLAISEIRVAYHLGQQDLGNLGQTLTQLRAQDNVHVSERPVEVQQRDEAFRAYALQDTRAVSRDMLALEGTTQATGVIRVAALPGQEEPGSYAAKVQQTLEQRGASVQELPGLGAPGSSRVLEYSYSLQQPNLTSLSRTLDELDKQPGVRVQEPTQTQLARELHAVLQPEAEAKIPTRQVNEQPLPAPEPAYNPRGAEKLAIVQIDEIAKPEEPKAKGRAEEVRERLEGAGASVGSIQSVVDERGIRHSEMLVSYRTDSPTIGAINKQLNDVPGSGGTVVEHPADPAQRQQAALASERAAPAREASPEVGR